MDDLLSLIKNYFIVSDIIDNLTLELGLRYEVDDPEWDDKHRELSKNSLIARQLREQINKYIEKE